MKEPIHQTGKIITFDSGFCMTAGILKLHNFGIYDWALIEKQGRYWPCNVLGDFIDELFHDKDISLRESLKQTINNVDFLYIVKRRRNMLQKSCQLMRQ